MQNKTVYLKCERNVEVQSLDVFMSDMGTVRCSDSALSARLRALKVHHFTKEGTKRCVISTLKLVELMENECSDISVQIVGESDVLVEWISVNKHKGWQHNDKTVIITITKRSQAVELRNFIRKTQPGAFIAITNSSEIIGKGFRGFN